MPAYAAEEVWSVYGRRGLWEGSKAKATSKCAIRDEGIVSTHWAKARFTLLSNKNKPLSEAQHRQEV